MQLDLHLSLQSDQAGNRLLVLFLQQECFHIFFDHFSKVFIIGEFGPKNERCDRFLYFRSIFIHVLHVKPILSD